MTDPQIYALFGSMLGAGLTVGAVISLLNSWLP